MIKGMDLTTFEELYFARYGEEFNWNNMNGLINEIIESTCDKQKKVCSELYVEKTTMSSGEFVGDFRIVKMLEEAPSPK